MAAHQSTPPQWFRLRLVQSGPTGGGLRRGAILIKGVDWRARSDGGQEKVHTNAAITSAPI